MPTVLNPIDVKVQVVVFQQDSTDDNEDSDDDDMLESNGDERDPDPDADESSGLSLAGRFSEPVDVIIPVPQDRPLTFE